MILLFIDNTYIHTFSSMDGQIDYARNGSDQLSWILKDLMLLRRRAQDGLVHYLDFQPIVNLQPNELDYLFIIYISYMNSKVIHCM